MDYVWGAHSQTTFAVCAPSKTHRETDDVRHSYIVDGMMYKLVAQSSQSPFEAQNFCDDGKVARTPARYSNTLYMPGALI